MNVIQHIRRFAGVLAGLVAVLLACGATPAFAVPPPPEPSEAATSPVVIHTTVSGGMPGWQITLIAVTAALLAATMAVLADRARASRKATAAAA
ncbi:MAG: hypothetical protein ACTHPS_14010 [Streptosporangiaceae bacterium]